MHDIRCLPTLDMKINELTPLQTAFKNNNEIIAIELIKRGSNIHVIDKEGRSLSDLMIIYEWFNVKVYTELIKAGYCPNICDWQGIPLIYSACYPDWDTAEIIADDYKELFDALIKANVDLSVKHTKYDGIEKTTLEMITDAYIDKKDKYLTENTWHVIDSMIDHKALDYLCESKEQFMEKALSLGTTNRNGNIRPAYLVEKLINSGLEITESQFKDLKNFNLRFSTPTTIRHLHKRGLISKEFIDY